MFEIHFCGEEPDSMDQKRKKLEIDKYKVEYKDKYTPESQAIADEKGAELKKAGFDVVILKTRDLMDIWSRKSEPQDKNLIERY